MSGIAQAWVASIRVGNQTAKQLLQFYAGHNFGKPGFTFKNSVLADQLEVGERAIREAHKFLLDKELIIREERYGKDGSQLTSFTYLNIPEEFTSSFLTIHDKKTDLGSTPPTDRRSEKSHLEGGGEDLGSGGGGSRIPPREDLGSPLNNKLYNNMNNKREREPLKPLSVDNFKPDQDNEDYAHDCKLDLEAELESFMNRHKGDKNQYEFRRWLKNAFNYKNKTPFYTSPKPFTAPKTANEVHSTVKEWGPGHPGWESLHGNQTKELNHATHGRDATARDQSRGNSVQKATSYLL